MDNDKEFLGREPVPKLLFKLALPTVVAQLVNLLYSIVDRIYIGHIPGYGSLALTGIGVCIPVVTAVSAFAALASSGGAPRVSIYMGRKDYETAENILGNCVSLLVIISLALTTILLLFHKPILLLFGASVNTIEYASSYLKTYALGTIFVQLTLGLNMFITTQGFANIGMKTVLIGAISNIILDPICIFVLGLGVQGAAIATIISQAFSCIWCLIFIFGKKSLLHIRRKYLTLNPYIIFPCIALGSATFIMYITDSIINVCFNSSLLKYGGDIAVGAMTICTTIVQFVMIPMHGIGQGSQPITSYNFGAKNADRVKETFLLLLKVCMLYSITMYLAVMLAPSFFTRFFTSDTDLINYTTTTIRIYCAAMFLYGIQISCQITFTSIGYALCSIIVALVRKVILLIPLIYLLPSLGILQNKVLSVFLAEPIADFFAMSFTAILFFFQFRKALINLSMKNE